MKAFKFQLEAVLTLREEKEQEAQRQVAGALNGVALVKAGLAGVARELEGLGEALKPRGGRGMPARDLLQIGNYRVVLTERHSQLQRDLAAAEDRVRQARAALLQATRDRQALENYRQKLRRIHDYRETRSEQKLLDDLAGRVPAPGSRRPTSPAHAS